MPKSRKKFYAVCIGREGPKIYETWDEVQYFDALNTDIDANC